MKYFFILGGNPALSLAEIFGLLNNFSLKNKTRIITFCKNFLIIESNEKIDMNKFIEMLGGTIKAGVVLKCGDLNIEVDDLVEKIDVDKNKKFYFGFSAYGKINMNFKQLAMDVKKELKQDGVSSRWVISREKQLSSVVVKKNKLVGGNGTEWCVMRSGDEIFWGRTLAVQEFEDYSRRDFDRPQRDSRSGMIPPKLAKIMINLARVELDYKIKNITMLDPFCGSGTILQEAAILGVDKLIGSDLSEKAVNDSEQNLKWLERRINNNQLAFQQTPLRQLADPLSEPALSLPKGGLREFPPDKGGLRGNEIKIESNKCPAGINLKIFNCDVRKLSELISENSVDLIVTEPYLGPPLNGREDENKINKIVQELSALYLSAFEEFKKILKSGGHVCVVWPIFSANNKTQKNIFLPIFDGVKKMGFRQVGFDADNYVNLIWGDKDELKNFKKNLADNFSECGNIIYGREGQMIKREIVVFKL